MRLLGSYLGRTQTQDSQPWQLQMFRRSLKKRQKLAALLDVVGDTADQQCLLVTCGDNNGALNWHFRAHGGAWTWGDVAGENLREMGDLLSEPVWQVPEDRFPFADGQFDCIVSIDVLEHLADDQRFLRELHRVLRPGGRAVLTVPNGDPTLLANRIKWCIGMTPEQYGHTRMGYTPGELRGAMERAGLRVIGEGGYSRFFTEMVELAINSSYVFLLSRQQGNGPQGHIAPTSSRELKTHGMAYRAYGMVFPLLQAIGSLDGLLPAGIDYCVIVEAIKPCREAYM